MILPSVRRPFSSAFLLVPVLAGALLCPSLSHPVFADEEDDIIAAEAKAWDDASDAITAAKTPLEKLNALYKRSRLPDSMEDPNDSDWRNADKDLVESLKIVDEIEKDGATKITEKANLYFRRGYILGSFSEPEIDYSKVIENYNLAEAAGYEGLHTKDADKGAELWNNRGNAKAHLFDFSGALQDFDIAIAHSSASRWYKNRSETKFQLGDYDGAVADWNAAKAIKADLGDIPYDPEAIPLNKAVIASPNTAAPLIARARFFVKKAVAAKVVGSGVDNLGTFMPYYVAYHPVDAPVKPKLKEFTKLELMNLALADLDRAVKVEPTSAAAWLERGRARNMYMMVPDWKGIQPFASDAPLKDFQSAVKADPRNAGAWLEMGSFQLTALKSDDLPTMGETEAQWAAKKESRVDEAIANISRAIYLKPDSSGEAHYLRGFVERSKSAMDYHTLIVDYTAAIAQKLSPIDDDQKAGAPDPARLAEAHSVLGEIAMAEGRLDNAVSELTQALQINDKDPDTHLDRGKVYVQQGKYDAAIADFSDVIALNPKLTEAWWLRGASHDGKDEVDLAKADLASAIKLDPSMEAKLDGSRYATQNPKPGVRIVPDPVKGDLPLAITGTALEHKEAGNALRGKKDIAGALAEYNNAIRIDPKFADAYCNRGSMYNDRGEIDLALADYARTIELDPKHRIVYLNRALAWRQAGEPVRERADLDKAVVYADTDERKANVFTERSTTRYSAGDKAGALADAIQATKLAPQNAFAWKALGRYQMNDGQYPDAVKSMRQVVALQPDNAAHVNLALALAYVGDAGAEAELKLGMEGFSKEEIKSIQGVIDVGLEKMPGSAVFQTLRADVAKAMGK